MANLNLYVKDSHEAIFDKLKQILEKEGRSMSEFLAEAAEAHINAQANPEEIALEGSGAKRIFTGHRLYWSTDDNCETGVFLTKKGKIAFWNNIEPETFEVYEDLDELFEEQDWLEEKRYRHIKREIQEQYKAITARTTVEHLDI